ncbi:hypothetical protein L596_014170 [Steinernema carpocapsae]|uniref:Beta-1,4-N-acetylgalactosaminyltransferase n=1 Tax=Steinernema carpocapsae TaxID=34508 RepID=A0A4U5NBN9_STECR|nr:hypothetical protein L596_014170 [Steinernema carpocapsae]
MYRLPRKHALLLVLFGTAVFLYSSSGASLWLHRFRNVSSQLPLFNVSHEDSLTLELCPEVPPGLEGPIRPDLRHAKLEELEKMYPTLGMGGHWKPEICKARQRVAIIVPFRNRENHLPIFLQNLHPLLQKQQLDYTIFVVEQIKNQKFNRAKLMNVGFVEARKLYDWQCYIFHDVDLIPENDKNMYSCMDRPKHMAVAVDKFNYELYWRDIVGGAAAFTREQMEKVNGFSNDYWGWGGEDNDMYKRAILARYKIHRDNTTITRYKMIKHGSDKDNQQNNCRGRLIGATKKRWKKDGLNSLNYTLLSMIKKPLFTYMMADMLEKESKEALKKENSSYVSC